MAGVSTDNTEVQTEGREALEASLSDETRKLAQMGRGEEVADENTEEAAKDADERPEWLPEKFKTPEDLLKSYTELEKRLGKGKSEEDEETKETPLKVGEKKPKEEDKSEDGSDDEGDDDEKGEDEKLPDFSSETVQTAITDVAAAYAETGELSDDMRKALNDVGISDDLIDTHMRGVKVQERLMRQEVFDLAGGEEVYAEAVEWARENWSDEEIEVFDKSLEKDKLRAKVVKGLIAEYRDANPGEGKLTTVKGGMDRGSVYSSQEEFQQDLAKAGDNRVEREKVIAKLRRSRKAGSIKGQSASPFGF